MLNTPLPGERSKRMRLEALVLLIKRERLWETQAQDISATGMFVTRPDDWDGAEGDEMAVEVVLGEGTIPLFARVARVTAEGIGIQFTRIPPASELPMWQLLGSHADAVEGVREAC